MSLREDFPPNFPATQGQNWKLKHDPESLTATPQHPRRNHCLLQMCETHIPEGYSQETEPMETFIIDFLTFTPFSKEKGQWVTIILQL